MATSCPIRGRKEIRKQDRFAFLAAFSPYLHRLAQFLILGIKMGGLRRDVSDIGKTRERA
jgi:hypothetical protein